MTGIYWILYIFVKILIVHIASSIPHLFKSPDIVFLTFFSLPSPLHALQKAPAFRWCWELTTWMASGLRWGAAPALVGVLICRLWRPARTFVDVSWGSSCTRARQLSRVSRKRRGSASKQAPACSPTSPHRPTALPGSHPVLLGSCGEG